MKKIKYLLLIFSLLSFVGCSYNIRNIILIDKNENAKNFIAVHNDSDYGDYSKDIKNQLELFVNIEDYELNPYSNALEIELKDKKPLNYFKYIKKETNNGVTILKIKIPPLVSYKIYDGSYQGTSLYLQVSLAKEFEIVNANSFDIETYKSDFDNLEYTKVVWEVPTSKLIKGAELIISYKLKQ